MLLHKLLLTRQSCETVQINLISVDLMIVDCWNKAQPASKCIACCTNVSKQYCLMHRWVEVITHGSQCSCHLARHPSAIKLSMAERLCVVTHAPSS